MANKFHDDWVRYQTSKTNALRGKLSNFQQTSPESIPKAWERLQEYIWAYINRPLTSALNTNSLNHSFLPQLELA
jgi:hypothetical protein